MFIIGGDQPQAEFTPLAMKRCEQWQQEQAARPARALRTSSRAGKARRR
jgi:hypothetical protein